MKTHAANQLPMIEVIGPVTRIHRNEVITVKEDYTDYQYDTTVVQNDSLLSTIELALITDGCDAIVANTLAKEIVSTRIITAIKQKRTAVKHGGVLVNTKWFHTDEESRSQYATMLAAVAVNSLPDVYVFDANWKTMDGTFVPMVVSTLKSIISTGMANESINYEVAEAHRVAVSLSADPAAYDFSTGWTAVYTTV